MPSLRRVQPEDCFSTFAEAAIKLALLGHELELAWAEPDLGADPVKVIGAHDLLAEAECWADAARQAVFHLTARLPDFPSLELEESRS